MTPKTRKIKNTSSIKIGSLVKNFLTSNNCNCGICKGSICIVMDKNDEDLSLFCDNKIIQFSNDDLDDICLKALK